LEKIGVHSDGFGTTDIAGWQSIEKPLPPVAANLIQQNVDYIYRRFINLVAEGRNTMPDLIHPIAQGRVWSASSAQEFGLVDQLGYLEDAIKAAATRAQLTEYRVEVIEKQLSPFEQLLVELSATALQWLPLQTDSKMLTAINQWQALQKNNTLTTLINIANSSQQHFSVMAHCVACADPLE
jgi:protease IV